MSTHIRERTDVLEGEVLRTEMQVGVTYASGFCLHRSKYICSVRSKFQ